MRTRLAGVVVAAALSLGGGAALADDQPADVCLQVTPDELTSEDWAAVVAAVGGRVAERSALFPSPRIDQAPTRIEIDSGHLGQAPGGVECLEPGAEWAARFGRDFLEAGADQMLAEAPTTPGIDSDVTIEWYPDEARLRTTLVFAGPLDIPNGTCWIDDTLSVDDVTGTAVASGEQGLQTSPFAEGACGRFFDHLPDGGAGGQAVTLLPVIVPLADGNELRFIAEGVRVTDDAVSIWGRLGRS